MTTHVEADGVPLPKGTAQLDAALAGFQLLGSLRFVALSLFQVVTEIVFISAILIAVVARRFLVLPFVSATAATISSVPTSMQVGLICIDWGIFRGSRKAAADRETQSLLFGRWLRVIHDMFQEVVDVEFYGDTSLFNVSNTRGIQDDVGDTFYQLVICEVLVFLVC